MKTAYKVFFIGLFFAQAIVTLLRAAGAHDYKNVAVIVLRFCVASSLLLMVSHPKAGVKQGSVAPVCALVALLYLLPHMALLH
jgi:hypothetical protein